MDDVDEPERSTTHAPVVSSKTAIHLSPSKENVRENPRLDSPTLPKIAGESSELGSSWVFVS